MSYVGRWVFHSIGAVNENDEMVFMNAEEYLASPMPYIDETDEEAVADEMKELLTAYNKKEEKTFDDILDFHVKFERIHPFQDGNGRVGRLIMFKECLKYNIVPFIIEDNLKMFYYRGLKEWNKEKGYLKDTCLAAQDKYKSYLDYFRIAY